MNRTRLMAETAADGLGTAFVQENAAAAKLSAGALVLEDWCPRIPGLCLYYAGHRHAHAALRAFNDTMRETEIPNYG